MEVSIVERILELNRTFYQSNADSFSASRSKPWKGWGRILRYFNEPDEPRIRVLDLGCGNARFYGYLKTYCRKEIIYTGIDVSVKLTEIAKRNFPKADSFSIIEGDVIRNIGDIDKKFNFVTAFGLTHHIPSKELRQRWFDSISKLVSESGYLILTFWQLKYFKQKQTNGLCQSDLENGDVFIGWENNEESVRYVHIFLEDEINEITLRLKNSGLKLIEKFTDDLNKNSDNLYLVFRKK